MTRTIRCLAALAAAASLALALGGCAAPPQDGGSASGIVTPSDETEARRRARIRLELAVGYFEQGKTEIALDEIKQVIAIDPAFPDAHNMRGLIYMRLNDNRQAEESFRRAVALNPRDADVHHNLGWLLCQQARYAEGQRSFDVAMANPLYPGRAKTLMAQGVCQARAGMTGEAEQSLSRSYELDPTNPVTGFNLASLLYRRGENQRAQFYIRNLNNSEYANAESLWLGIKVERRMNDMVALRQLGEQLRKRFGGTREASAYERGSFDE
ncbi:type IV pilus biogenesis/stability protein PilW [Ramlibacter sp. PS4R-6]|uniref:type IV pilus biogenesis/stability protein PilW n=1 Tax=Ramlibacter sp. PS4R-6 TaxID=3133438 RepID=UPI0030955962